MYPNFISLFEPQSRSLIKRRSIKSKKTSKKKVEKKRSFSVICTVFEVVNCMDLDNILCVIDNFRILQQNFGFL